MIEHRPIGAGAVEILGLDLDLDQPLTAAAKRAVLDAHRDCPVVLLRDQSLSKPAQIELTRCFGACEPHPLASHRGPEPYPQILVIEHRPGTASRRNDVWHTDVSFAAEPPSVTMLHALEVPDALGDTLLCNMVMAYERLSSGLKKLLGGLQAVHSAAPEVARVNLARHGVEPMEVPPAVAHPVVRTHEESGQRALYVNPWYTSQFAGMTVEESDPLLAYLYRAAIRPEHIYRHRWRAGDVLLWDNARVIHYAVRDYGDEHTRVMHRTTAAGPRPV